MEDKGVSSGLEVDIASKPPVVLRKDLDHFEEYEPGLHRSLAAVVHGLAPGLAMDLKTGDDRDTSVVIRERLL